MRFKIFDLGLVGYKEAWDFQKEVHLAVKNKHYPCGLILCQHHPAITLGRGANKNNILASEADLKLKGIQVYQTERGGDITYHGPGQLTLYPVIDLVYFKRDIHLFLRYLEQSTMDLLSEFGIEGERISGLTGAWVNGEKIASIGIAIKSWITFHGLSINIKDYDLPNFGLIRPCGMDIKMTSLETLLNKDVQIGDIKKRIVHIMEAPRSRRRGAPATSNKEVTHG